MSGSGSATRGSAGGHSTGNLFQTGLAASWALDVFGANRSALDVEQAGTAALPTSIQLPLLATRIGQTRHALALLAGQPPAALADTLSNVPAAVAAPEPLHDLRPVAPIACRPRPTLPLA